MPILASAMPPGDTLIWKSYTLQSAPGNRLDRRRAAFSVNWVGDEIVYNAKASLETYRDSTLTIGKPIVCKEFPLVRCT
jgi:ectoine hydroxylase-related dioxygenase (phytanoyl-CoA dioxygenase family)